MSSEKIKKPKKSVYFYINIILVIAFVLLCGPMWMIPTLGITVIFYIPAFVSNIALPLLYDKYRRYGRFRPALIITRCIAVLSVLIIFTSPIICMNFDNSRAMYHIKRAVFVYGVKHSASDALPSRLYGKCYDYSFITQPQWFAMDYHPCGVLSFRCDKEDIQTYIDDSEKKGLKKRTYEISFEERLGDIYYDSSIMSDKVSITALTGRYLGIPGVPCSRFTHEMSVEEIIQFAEGAEVYEKNGISCFAVDRGTGLVAFWS